MRRDFTKLDVWKRAHLLTLEVYECVKKFPEEEQDGLGADVCRAAMSVGATIARSCAFEEDEFREGLAAALESAWDVEMNLILIREHGILSQNEQERLEKRTDEVKSLLQKQIANRKIRSS